MPDNGKLNRIIERVVPTPNGIVVALDERAGPTTNWLLPDATPADIQFAVGDRVTISEFGYVTINRNNVVVGNYKTHGMTWVVP
jgi:hypothetical protein